ncbi:MAG: hypothetical protein RLZZ141_1460, partial [Pseudomonadota bacterium]
MQPPTPAARVLPPEGEDLRTQIFPPWGKWPEGPKGVLFAVLVFKNLGQDSKT